MTRIVAYAPAAQKDPTTAHTMARERSAGVEGTGSKMPPDTLMEPCEAAEGSEDGAWPGKCEKMNAGRAMKSTPEKAMTPAMASRIVNGSWTCQWKGLRGGVGRELTRRAIQHTKPVIVGTRNVITVASAMSRNESESKLLAGCRSMEES